MQIITVHERSTFAEFNDMIQCILLSMIILNLSIELRQISWTFIQKKPITRGVYEAFGI